MALKFQYNKTALQVIQKQLKQRYSALPTLKNKESALRAEVKRYKISYKKLTTELEEQINAVQAILPLFVEYKSIIKIENILIKGQKIAGVQIPVLDDITFNVLDFSLFNSPVWLREGAEALKSITKLKILLKVELRKIDILDYARKKTTQKVNLYEKVQIPAFEDAIIKIKRFLADEENLDRASQKIVKKRKEAVL